MEMDDTVHDESLSEQRMLAAIMFTDVAGFSIHMGEDEERTVRCVERDLKLVTKLCGEFHGRVLKRMGDGILAVFLSAVGSVECAQEIQRQLAEQARGLDPKNILHHRIGIHLGDVFIQDDEVMGDGVNIAARLQNEAPPGGICISQALYGVVKRRLNIKTVHRGAKHLKNIREQVHIYQLVVGDTPPGKAFAPFNARQNIWKRLIIPSATTVILILVSVYLRPWERIEKEITESSDIATAGTDSIESQAETDSIAPEDTPAPSETVIVDEEALTASDQIEEPAENPRKQPDPGFPPVDSTGAAPKPPLDPTIEHEPEARIFKRFDVNQDGRLSWSELPHRGREQIMRADFDKDGWVTWDEIVRAIRIRREKHRIHPTPND